MSSVATSWPVVSLFDFCNPKQWPTIPQSAFVDQGYPVYGANGKIGHYPKFNHEQPTVLITCRGATCGTINVCEPKSYVTGNSMALDDLDQSRVSADYLVYALRNGSLAQAISGTAQPHITRQSLTVISIPLPPLAAQRRIAEVLDRAEALRAKRRAALAQLESLTQSLFLDLFGNPIENTKAWPTSRLEEVARVERGKFTPRPRNDPSYYGGRFPFIQTGDISNSGGRVKSWSQTLNEKGVAVSRSFPQGTVVIAIVGATLGLTAILDVEVYCPDSVVGIQLYSEKASAEYIERILRFWRPIFVAQAPETARANINLETLRPLRVPTPPIELQREFARRVEAVEKLKTAQRASMEELDALFATLQHRAFRGELFGVPPSGGAAHERKGA